MGAIFASGAEDHTIRIGEVATGKDITSWMEGHKWIISLAFSPDGQRLVSGSRTSTVWLWDAEAGEQFRGLRGHEKPVVSVAFSADGTRISGGEDLKIFVWDVETGEAGTQGSSSASHSHLTASLSYRALKTRRCVYGPLLLATYWAVYDVGDSVDRASFSPDSMRIISRSSSGRIHVWDADLLL